MKKTKKSSAKAVKTAVKPAVKKSASKATPGKSKTAVKAVPAEKSVKAVKKAVPAKAKEPVKKAPVKTPAAAVPVSPKTSGNAQKGGQVKMKLSKADKKYFLGLLMIARSAFDEQVKFHTDEALTSKKDSAGERAGMATHMADLGTDNFRHELELGLLSEEVDVLEMIDEAIQRIEDDEYGICLDCGCEISRGRLEVKPYAKFCTKCKSRRESVEDPTHRRR